MKKFKYMIIDLIAILVLAACSSVQTESLTVIESGASEQVSEMTDNTAHDQDTASAHDDAVDAVMEETGNEMAEEEHDDSMADDSANMADLPAWQQIELTNARTGETFTFADFSGKTVFVEPMATWCTNCRRQLGNVRDARARIGDENTIFIGLSLETTISDEQLAQYQSDQGFDWTFAVMTPELLQALSDTFGRSITSAPSTPHFIIRPDGSLTDLVTGIESPDQLVQQLQAAGG